MLCHQLLHSLLHNQRATLQLSKAQMARRVDASNNAVAKWLDNLGEVPLKDVDRLLDAAELGCVVARQPNNAHLPIIDDCLATRQQLGLKLWEVAQWIDVPVQTLSRWENGIGRGPALYRLNLWSLALGLGGLRASRPPRIETARPAEYEPEPTREQSSLMIANRTYEAYRYIPFTLEYAKTRIELRHIGYADHAFFTSKTFEGHSLMLAKFRPLWAKFALRHGDIHNGLVDMIRVLTAARAQRAVQANTLDK